jgi:hypothetical protein
MLPNEHWTEDSTMKLIEELLQDGKLVEIEPGKYKSVIEYEKYAQQEEGEEGRSGSTR